MKINYPCVFSLQVVMDLKTTERSVLAVPTKGKSKIENKKFQEVKAYLYDSDKQTAVIDVVELNNEEELQQKLIELTNNWATI